MDSQHQYHPAHFLFPPQTPES